MLIDLIRLIIMKLIRSLAYLSLPYFILNYVAKRHALTRYYLRVSLYLSAMSVSSLYGVLIALPMTVAGRRFDINWAVARSFQKITSALLGFSWEVEGEENIQKDRSVVYVGSHQSMLDLMYLGRYVFPAPRHFRQI